MARGLAAHRAGRLAEAEAAYRQVLRLAPGHGEALRLSGVLANVGGRPDLAVGMLEQALARDGANPDHHVYLGMVLQRLGRFADAEARYRAALTLNPDHPAALTDLGLALQGQNRRPEAEASFLAAIRVGPELAAAHANLGVLLCETGRPEEGEAALRRAIRLQGERPETLSNLGMALMAQRRLAEAQAVCREAVRLDPGHVPGHMNLASSLLLAGRLREGLAAYEWRRAPHPLSAPMPAFPVPAWRGEPLGGRTLLVHAEQGLGDTLQFCRFAPLAATGGRVIFWTPTRP